MTSKPKVNLSLRIDPVIYDALVRIAQTRGQSLNSVAESYLALALSDK